MRNIRLSCKVFSCLLQDRRGSIKTIADFLGRDLTEVQIDRALEETNLHNMKTNRSCNFSYFEDKFETEKTEGAFINTG